MGFGEAGAAAVVFTGLLIAAGVLYPAVDANRERLSEAEQGRTDRALDRANADAVVVNATYDTSAGELTVRVNNTGATTFDVTGTDLLVDGAYATYDASVDGTAGRTVWAPGQQLVLTHAAASAPDRVKVVAETGTADTAGVAVVA